MYKEMTSAEGRQVCLKGWQVASIKDAVGQGLSKLSCLDTFEDIDPMLRGNAEVQTADLCGISELRNL